MTDVPDTSGWTLTTLYTHFMAILDERDKAVRAALAASEKGIDRVAADSDRRFATVNEFRGTLTDQAALFITRAEVEAAISRNTERIQELADRVNKSEGRGAGLNAGWLIIAAAVPMIAAVVAIFVALR